MENRTFKCEKLSVDSGLWEECYLSDIRKGDVFRVFDSYQRDIETQNVDNGVRGTLADMDGVSQKDAEITNMFRRGTPLMARCDAHPENMGTFVNHVSIINCEIDPFAEEGGLPVWDIGGEKIKFDPGDKLERVTFPMNSE